MMTKLLVLALLVSSLIFAGTILARGYGSGDGPGQNYTDWSSGSDQSVEDQKREIDSLQKEKDRKEASEPRDSQSDPKYNSNN
ncbi:MAG: hypothetical protein ACKVLB_04495 [Burkholderiales bacterium]|jgi:hypothetical protein|tara:strand:- start:329 stop:577 length:249 start_codon:yes stop_codon:yes gene_type:complete